MITKPQLHNSAVSSLRENQLKNSSTAVIHKLLLGITHFLNRQDGWIVRISLNCTLEIAGSNSACFVNIRILHNIHLGVTGIQGKRELEWERKMGHSCYSSDSLLVKFRKLRKPSHKYSIVFLSHNKHQPAQKSISTDAIHNLL